MSRPEGIALLAPEADPDGEVDPETAPALATPALAPAPATPALAPVVPAPAPATPALAPVVPAPAPAVVPEPDTMAPELACPLLNDPLELLPVFATLPLAMPRGVVPCDPHALAASALHAVSTHARVSNGDLRAVWPMGCLAFPFKMIPSRPVGTKDARGTNWPGARAWSSLR